MPKLILEDRRHLAQQLAWLEEDQGIEELALARFQLIDQEEERASSK